MRGVGNLVANLQPGAQFGSKLYKPLALQAVRRCRRQPDRAETEYQNPALLDFPFVRVTGRQHPDAGGIQRSGQRIAHCDEIRLDVAQILKPNSVGKILPVHLIDRYGGGRNGFIVRIVRSQHLHIEHGFIVHCIRIRCRLGFRLYQHRRTGRCDRRFDVYLELPFLQRRQVIKGPYQCITLLPVRWWGRCDYCQKWMQG